MLSTALTLLALGGATAQDRLPDQLDLLRGADRTPQLKLLLDLSYSMALGHASSPCAWYLGQLGRAPTDTLNRIEQLVAVLTGCRSPNDGIIDRWASQIVFSVDGYLGSNLGPPFPPLTFPEIFPFPTTGPTYSTDAASLEAALVGLPNLVLFDAGTPLARGYRISTEDFDSTFTDSNTEQCRENAIIVMTDGEGNGPSATFDWIQNTSNLTVRDAFGCFVSEQCSFGFEPPHPDEAAEYLYGEPDELHDALTRVDGIQPIRTHTIDFNAPEDAKELLRAMAEEGGGSYFPADNYDQLASAFNSAIYQVNANADASFQGITVQGDGVFAGNFVYQNLIQGSARSGHWYGNIKKFCLFPDPPTYQDCYLEPGPGPGEWLLNPNPRDVWTGRTGFGTRVGGAGERILSSLVGAPTEVAPAGTPANQPPFGRNIITWKENQFSYVNITDLDFRDTRSITDVRHFSLINKLYGYTFANGATIPNNPNLYLPVAYDVWPLADSVNGDQVLLKYSATCGENSGDNCYLATVSNAGMLHIIDAVTGDERSAVIPLHFFRPNHVAHNILSDILDQPTPNFTRRYYYDGGVSLYHDDSNQNGYIDSTEEAFLIAGFGRGGAGYMAWEVSEMPNGLMNQNRVWPLVRDQQTGLKYLRDTWATPWVGRLRMISSLIAGDPVAIFPSGHEADLDAPDAPFAEIRNIVTQPSYDTETSPFTATCADLGIPAGICRTPTAQEVCAVLGPPCGPWTSSTCVPCLNPAGCGSTNPPCYDWPGFSNPLFATTDLSQFGISRLYPLLVNAGPYHYQNGNTRGIAYRIAFTRVNLQPNDTLEILDDVGNVIDTYHNFVTVPGQQIYSSWIYSPGFRLRVATNGIDDAEAYGIEIDHIQVIRDVVPSAPEPVLPTVYVASLRGWVSRQSFHPIPGPNDASQGSALLLRFTSDCSQAQLGPTETCIDQSTSTDTEDLRYLTCPISAEPNVLVEGGLARGIYFGDECGQVWSFTLGRDELTWTARRLLTTNQRENGFTVPGRESRNYRKIFSKSDLVVSTCTGRRAIGVYFGTGNLQRPAAIANGASPSQVVLPNLEDPLVTQVGSAASNRDIIGVVWDTTDVPSGGYTLADLADATTTPEVNARIGARNGFFIELDRDEKSLRRPLVLDGVANFQTYQPTTAATECDDAVGNSFFYAFDNCTAAPVQPNATGPSDRRVLLNDSSLIGGEIVVATPKDGDPVVLAGDGRQGHEANMSTLVDPDRRGPRFRLFLWRINVD